MSIQFKTPQFKKLQEKWYKKLADSGFVDAESDEDHLKRWEGHAFAKSRYQIATFESKQKYFALAGQFLNEKKFETKKDRMIWEMHSEGKSTRDISIVLKKKKIPSPSKDTVNIVIRKLAKEMLQKYDLSDDL